MIPTATNNDVVSSFGHQITLQRFELPHDDAVKCETSIGWRWFIRKVNNEKEHLAIFCRLVDPAQGTKYGLASGEGLDCIEIENTTHHLHIGTEDEEIMYSRSMRNDWMPKRLGNQFGMVNPLITYIDFGFEAEIPALLQGEKIYLHFVVATNPIKPSIGSPDFRDISSWYAVDQYKSFLDSYLGNGVFD